MKRTTQAALFSVAILVAGTVGDYLAGLDPFRSQPGAGFGKGLFVALLLIPIGAIWDAVSAIRARRARRAAPWRPDEE